MIIFIFYFPCSRFQSLKMIGYFVPHVENKWIALQYG